MTPWELHGRSFGNCNCAFGCPCQFNALPTYGTCEAAVGYIKYKRDVSRISLPPSLPKSTNYRNSSLEFKNFF